MRMATVCLLACSLAVAQDVKAQVIRMGEDFPSLAGNAPTDPALPDKVRPVDPTLRQRSEATGSSQPGPPSADSLSSLTPLILLAPVDAHDGILRQQGTRGRIEFEVFAATPGEAASLVLAYRNSIAVLPEASSVAVTINDREVTRFTPRAFDGFARETLRIPAGLLRPGPNRIVLELQLFHRIYCSPEAWFQLWSDWDLSSSGIALHRAAGRPLLMDDFRAALRAMAGSGRILVIRRDAVTLIDEAGTFARLIGILGAATGGSLPPVEVRDPYQLREPAPPPARVTFLASGRSHIGIRQGGDGAVVLVIEYPPGQLADLGGLASLLPPQPAAPPAIPALEPGTTQALSNLGFEAFSGSDIYSFQQLRFRLPEDWLILTNQPATLALVHSAMPSLPAGSRLVIRINGEAVRLIRLDGVLGSEEPLEIRFEGRRLQPGVNNLEFQAILPGELPEQPCSRDTTERFRISPASTLHVPVSPRMILPDLGRELARVEHAEIRITGDGLRLQAALQDILVRPTAGTDPGHGPGRVLHVIDLDHLPPLLQDRPDLREMSIRSVLQPLSGQNADPGALAERPGQPGRLPLTTGEVMTWLQLAVGPGQGSLDDWLRGRKARALLASGGPSDPDSLWLVLGPGADPARVVKALENGLVTPDRPQGAVALLDAHDHWQSWRSDRVWPRLLEPIRPANLRAVLGAYVSWAPGLLVVAGLGVSWIVAIGAWLAIRAGRARRQG
ncbi:cellulose biosynthesis cyclic di-GMP-binding regulatory protein BcsB [Cereibacter sphaeroides]|uniref:cellulose biosynthesis cyclic di-GMP-binding regulatory protein BcsB n=1 Tax=Cereibacter sphaeroides TaxID=1063 RepID=UPI001F1AF109|nr:cellulose biosynthesis cyclic di-GMP-binding regulatory protein BcsB [Cereibacter sphaeroides]MCE6949898.1 cellulose biosynthesis cyclic di-GMP-binding regulatory protein BcsB [Cereibacter sphaeroides]